MVGATIDTGKVHSAPYI